MHLFMCVCLCVCVCVYVCVALIKPSVPPPLQRSHRFRSASQSNELLSPFEDVCHWAFCSALELPGFQEVQDVFFPLDQGCRLLCFLLLHTHTPTHTYTLCVFIASCLKLYCLFQVAPSSPQLRSLLLYSFYSNVSMSTGADYQRFNV